MAHSNSNYSYSSQTQRHISPHAWLCYANIKLYILHFFMTLTSSLLDDLEKIIGSTNSMLSSHKDKNREEIIILLHLKIKKSAKNDLF